MTCGVPGCESPVVARGWCELHYRRWRRHGSTDLPDRPSESARFWERVDKAGPVPAHVPSIGNCWVWTGARFKRTGRHAHLGEYGAFTRGGSPEYAHRVAWEMAHGAIAEGVFVLHRCDNPPCVRLAHLFLGDAAVNAEDRDIKGRANTASGERNGSRTRPDRQVRGERHGMARLTEGDVRTIRRLLAEGQTQREVADAFGVSQSVVSNIRNRRRWAHVE